MGFRREEAEERDIGAVGSRCHLALEADRASVLGRK